MIRNTVFKKLKSNDGASLMLALLFFVMCATVGSIILTAATTASGRLKNLTEDDQTYYATSSAAELITTEVKGYSVQIEKEKTIVGSTSSDETNATVNGKAGTEVSAVIDKLLYEKISNAASSSSEEVSFNVSGKSQLAASATFSMDDDYSLRVVIKAASNDKINNITLLFPAAIENTESIVEHDNREHSDAQFQTKRKIITEYLWNEPTVMKGASE